jgi:PAS domain S-box-containing protein
VSDPPVRLLFVSHRSDAAEQVVDALCDALHTLDVERVDSLARSDARRADTSFDVVVCDDALCTDESSVPASVDHVVSLDDPASAAAELVALLARTVVGPPTDGDADAEPAMSAVTDGGDGTSGYVGEGTAPPEISSAQLHNLAATTPDAIVTIDAENVVQYANPAVEEILGYAPEELVGEPLSVLMSGPLAAVHSTAFERYLETGDRTLDWNNVELSARHRDGSEVPLSVSFSEFTHDGERRFTGILRETSFRKERERELERANAMLETVRDGVYALDDEGRFIAMNQAYADMVGYDREALLGEPSTTVTGTTISAEAQTIQSELLGSGADAKTYETVIQTGAGEPLPVEARISLFPMGEDRYGRAGVVRDITDRLRREDQLKQLNEFSQALTSAETVEEVCDIAVQTAHETLDLPLTSIKRYDAEQGRLVPVSRTEEVDRHVGDDPLFGPDADIPWQVFTEQVEQVFDDVEAKANLSTDDTPLASGMVVPIGRFGVFVAGAGDADTFGDHELTLAHIFVASIEAALKRVDREVQLRERTEELEDRTRTLERVNRINSVIRDITRTLTTASTREEVEQTVCRQLADAEPYRFVWIGEQNAIGGDIVPRASAGVERGYLDAIRVSTDDHPQGSGPGSVASRTHRTQVEDNLHTEPPFEPWRKEALQRGYRACIAIPLVYRETLYGVLNLYANTAGVFDDLEVTVLEELGQMIGYAINALERKRALVSDSAVELKFAINDAAVPAVQFARREGARIEFEALVEEADGKLRGFYSVHGADPPVIEEYARRSTVIGDFTFIAERDEGYFYEATITRESFFTTLLEAGAHPTSLTATADGATLTVELPSSGDITAFLEMFFNRFEDAELLTRHELGRPIRTEAEFSALYKERLTTRQEEVVRTAYYAGFFNFPRDSSGSDVAAMLGVSQPTVNRHIRHAERKLFELVFEDSRPDDGRD